MRAPLTLDAARLLAIHLLRAEQELQAVVAATTRLTAPPAPTRPSLEGFPPADRWQVGLYET